MLATQQAFTGLAVPALLHEIPGAGVAPSVVRADQSLRRQASTRVVRLAEVGAEGVEFVKRRCDQENGLSAPPAARRLRRATSGAPRKRFCRRSKSSGSASCRTARWARASSRARSTRTPRSTAPTSAIASRASPRRIGGRTRPWSNCSARLPSGRRRRRPRSRSPGCWPRSRGSSQSRAPRFRRRAGPPCPGDVISGRVRRPAAVLQINPQLAVPAGQGHQAPAPPDGDASGNPAGLLARPRLSQKQCGPARESYPAGAASLCRRWLTPSACATRSRPCRRGRGRGG
jgi:hypothetical protein